MELEFNERGVSARDGELVHKQSKQQNSGHRHVWSHASAFLCCPYQVIVFWCSTLLIHIHGPEPAFMCYFLACEDILSF